MGNEWKELLIQDVIELSSGKPLSPSFDKQKGRFPVLGSNGILGYCSEALVNEPVVTIGRVGACGSIHKSDKPTWISDNTLIAKPKENIDLKFIYYLFLSVDFKPIIGGTTQPLITQTAVKGLRVRIPKLKVQKAIASILGSIDDKIELNRQINEKLEAIAQALFKSWFIDFDPVRAKAEGRNTGLPEHISSLFPASFVDSELGQIPEGWSTTSLTDQFDVVKGTSYLSEDLCSSDSTSTALVTLKSIGRQGGYKEEGLKPYKGRYKDSQELVSGDVVISCTDVTQQAEVIGRAAVVCRHPSYRHLVASLDLVKLISKKDTISPLFIYLLSKTEAYVSHMLSFTTGTTVLHLDKAAFKNLKLVAPPQIVMAVFNKEVDSIFRRINLAAEHNGILKKVRDTLLPKLISGELPIPDAERIVGRYL